MNLSTNIYTNKGILKVHLFEKNCPKSVELFQYLINQKFYDGLYFFKHIKNELIQTGCPDNTGIGWIGWHSKTENHPNHNPRYGSIGFASSQKDQTSSQFFICLSSKAARYLTKQSYFGYISSESYDILKTLKVNDFIEKITIEQIEL